MDFGREGLIIPIAVPQKGKRGTSQLVCRRRREQTDADTLTA
jgi:hypothetical protein